MKIYSEPVEANKNDTPEDIFSCVVWYSSLFELELLK